MSSVNTVKPVKSPWIWTIMGVASLWLGVWQLLLLCLVWAGHVVRGKEHICSPGRLPQIIKIGKFPAWLLVIGGMLCVPSCYWLGWVRQVVQGMEHVCSPGRLPQIIRIGKFHAWLLMIGGMLCVPSCYWLAGWGRWSLSAARSGYHRSSELVIFMHGCLWLVGRYVCHLAIGWSGRRILSVAGQSH